MFLTVHVIAVSGPSYAPNQMLHIAVYVFTSVTFCVPAANFVAKTFRCHRACKLGLGSTVGYRQRLPHKK